MVTENNSSQIPIGQPSPAPSADISLWNELRRVSDGMTNLTTAIIGKPDMGVQGLKDRVERIESVGVRILYGLAAIGGGVLLAAAVVIYAQKESPKAAAPALLYAPAAPVPAAPIPAPEAKR